MKPPPLQLLSRLVGGPDTSEQAELQAALLPLAADGTRRGQVVGYLLGASAGGGRVTGRRGSLKHILWWLRDHAGGLYEEAVMAVLESALAGTWRLDAAGEALRDHPLLGGLVRQSLQSVRADDLARHLVWEETPRGRVAWNRTSLNLSKIAFSSGAAWYVALSIDGGCVMGSRNAPERGLIEGFVPGGCGGSGWTQPYPNLVVLTRPASLHDEAQIRQWFTGAA